MAGEWIKVEMNTPDKPEVFKIARLLGIDTDLVFGKLIKLWAWFDKNSVDGSVDGVVAADIDAIVRKEGFAKACEAVDWLCVDEVAMRVSLPRFDRHNGETAKKRALKNARQSKWRQGKDSAVDAPASTSGSTQASTPASTREEKRREEEKTPAAPAPEEVLWNDGLKLLLSTGSSETSARSFIGRLVKDHGVSEALRGFEAAIDAKAGDPKAYISAVLGKTNGARRLAF